MAVKRQLVRWEFTGFNLFTGSVFVMFAMFSHGNPAYAANAQTFKASCGGTEFRVDVLNNGYAFDNTYTLFAETAAGPVELFKGQDWFYAACLTSRSGRPLLVFQNYCSGSACNEKNYGAVDPANLELILKPSLDQPENAQEISALLGFEVPNLAESDAAFCCQGSSDAATGGSPSKEAATEAVIPVKPQSLAALPKPPEDLPYAALAIAVLFLVVGLGWYGRKKRRRGS